jgi:hypothetical protein
MSATKRQRITCDTRAALEAERRIESIISSRGGMGMTGMKLFRGIILDAIKDSRCLRNKLTIESPSVVAVYLTVPTQFVHRSNIYEWTKMRRAMSESTFKKCLMLLCRIGLIESRPGPRSGEYKQKTTKENRA